MKIRSLVVAVAIAVVGLFPLSSNAYATHSCGFEPCPHVEDVFDILCAKFAVMHKLGLCS